MTTTKLSTQERIDQAARDNQWDVTPRRDLSGGRRTEYTRGDARLTVYWTKAGTAGLSFVVTPYGRTITGQDKAGQILAELTR